MAARTLFLSEEGQRALEGGLCPYCDGFLEDNQGFIEDGPDGQREGGLCACDSCKVRFAWINNPFECEIEEDEASNVL